MKKYIKYLVSVLFAFVFSIIIVVFTTELYLRFFKEYAFSPGYSVSHPTRRVELKKNFRGTTYGISYSINSDGLRDYEREIDYSAFRIGVFGDSIPFGPGVKTENLFPKVLERLLIDNTGKNIQVFNFGCPSYNFDRKTLYLMDINKKYKLDIAVLCYTMNDTENTPNTNFINKHNMLKKIKDSLRFLYSYNYFATKIYRIIDQIKNKVNNGDFVTFHEIAYSDNYIGWKVTREAIKKVMKFSDENNIDLFICLVEAGNKKLSQHQNIFNNFSILEKYIRSTGFNNFYNINDIFEKYNGNIDDLSVKSSDSHFSKKAHKMIGEELYRILNNHIQIPSK